MNSLILQIASKYVKPILLILGIIALLRGHNYPGGGFIGGLLAALSIVLSSLAFNSKEIKSRMLIKPVQYIGIGLMIIIISFLPSLLKAEPLMKGIWVTLKVPLIHEIKLGTPFLFDVGVFLTVIGVTLMFLFTLSIKE
ncbi:MAG: MnhB domain-containing protein [Bacteroidales bacterium]|jgi:multicomponent Na+:H+ antiporter subunit B